MSPFNQPKGMVAYGDMKVMLSQYASAQWLTIATSLPAVKCKSFLIMNKHLMINPFQNVCHNLLTLLIMKQIPSLLQPFLYRPAKQFFLKTVSLNA